MKKIVNDFFSNYLLFSLSFSLGLWLFNDQLFKHDFSHLFFSSLNLVFHFHYFSQNAFGFLKEEKVYFFEVFAGQLILLSLASFESGLPLVGLSLYLPVYGVMTLEGLMGFVPLLNDDVERACENSEDEVKKLFFHDLINKTHGMKLFLKNRLDQKNGINDSELGDLFCEVEGLQLLIQDHFKEYHKNLNSLQNYVSLEKALEGVKRLMNYFLEERGERIFFNDDLKVKNSPIEGKIHYPSFYRIFGNLIKNIADHGGENVKIFFGSEGNGFCVNVQNNFDSTRGQEKDVDETFGLRSIHKNCLEQGGTFTFKVEQNMWKSEIWLPFYDENKKREAIL